MSQLFDLSSLDSIKADRLITQVKRGLQPVESDEAILRFLREQQRQQGAMTILQFRQAYILRHDAIMSDAAAISEAMNFVPSDDPPPYNPLLSPAHARFNPSYNPLSSPAHARFHPPRHNPLESPFHRVQPQPNDRAAASGGVAMSAARPSDLALVLQQSIDSETFRKKQESQLDEQLQRAIALSMEDVGRRLPEQQQLKASSAAPMPVAAVPVNYDAQAPVCSPSWCQLSPEQRNPFYFPGSKVVNVTPVVEFPNPKPTPENPGQTISVPNLEMKNLLGFFFSETTEGKKTFSMKEGQNNFLDTCPHVQKETLLFDVDFKRLDLLGDFSTYELMVLPVILSDGTSCSKASADAAKDSQGVSDRDKRKYASARPNLALQAFIDSLTPEEKESFGGKSRNMQKNRRKSQNRKRSQSRKRSQNRKRSQSRKRSQNRKRSQSRKMQKNRRNK
jgi:hypothetical protein